MSKLDIEAQRADPMAKWTTLTFSAWLIPVALLVSLLSVAIADSVRSSSGPLEVRPSVARCQALALRPTLCARAAPPGARPGGERAEPVEGAVRVQVLAEELRNCYACVHCVQS